MRSERLTRKTHFRKLSPKIVQRNATADSVIDLTVENQTSREDLDEGVWSLSELLSMAHIMDARTVEEHPFSFTTEQDALLWCVRMMNESPTARMLCNDADRHDWAVGVADLKNEGFCIDTDERLILLDHFCLSPNALGRSGFFRHVMLTTFIRALRDVWHEERLHEPEKDYSPEQVLMLERVRAADCDTVTILCGWELRGAGFTEVWRHLLGSEEGDMAVVFTRFLERDPGALFTGAALAYAFRQWYADLGRVDGTDHDTLEAMDDLIENSDWPNPFGQKRMDPNELEQLAMLPDGTCYLAGLGDGIMRDPFFAGLNDPINQTHLFHLMYDMEVVMVNNVPFRDSKLARRIFPQADVVRVKS